MSAKPLVASALIAGLAIGGGALWWLAQPRDQTVAAPSSERTASADDAGQGAPEANSPIQNHLGPQDGPTVTARAAPVPKADLTLAEAFSASEDLYAFAEQLRADANAGNGQAQWYLAEVFDQCEFVANKFGGKSEAVAERTLNNWQDQMGPQAAAFWRTMYERCDGFAADPLALERPEIWRTLAAESGDPAAVLASLVYKTIPNALENPNLYQVAGLIERGGHPALRQAKLLLQLDTGNSGAASDAIRDTTWDLLQCELGADCGPGSQAVLIHCRWGDCVSDDSARLPELIAREADPFVLTEASRLAERLAEAIRSRQLAESGLVDLSLPEPPPTPSE